MEKLTVAVLRVICSWPWVLAIGTHPGILKPWQKTLHEGHVQRVWRIVEITGHNHTSAILHDHPSGFSQAISQQLLVQRVICKGNSKRSICRRIQWLQKTAEYDMGDAI